MIGSFTVDVGVVEADDVVERAGPVGESNVRSTAGGDLRAKLVSGLTMTGSKGSRKTGVLHCNAAVACASS